MKLKLKNQNNMLESFIKSPNKAALLAGLERQLNENFGHIKGLVEVTIIKNGAVHSVSIQRADSTLIARLQGLADEDHSVRIIDLDDVLDLVPDYVLSLAELENRLQNAY
jgi:hypothetical protein